MSEKMRVPVFASEAEEAQWWFDNQEGLGDDLDRAFENGSIGRGTGLKRALLMQDGVVPEPVDVEKARTLAEKKGVPYQDFLKQLIHTALQQELSGDHEHAEAA